MLSMMDSGVREGPPRAPVSRRDKPLTVLTVTRRWRSSASSAEQPLDRRRANNRGIMRTDAKHRMAQQIAHKNNMYQVRQPNEHSLSHVLMRRSIPDTWPRPG